MVDVAKDLPELILWFEKQNKAVDEFEAALMTKISSEPGHLEKLKIEEKNMAKDDAESLESPLEDDELAAIMQAHKDASPFGLDVAAAKAKWMQTIKE